MPKQAPRSASRARSAKRMRVAARRKSVGKPARPDLYLPDDESHVDGCDLDFNESDATPDEELPESRGGVETVRKPQRRTARLRR